MPLKSGKSKATISKNIEELHGGKTYAHTMGKFGKARADAQAIAIAMDKAGMGMKKKMRKHMKGGGMS